MRKALPWRLVLMLHGLKVLPWIVSVFIYWQKIWWPKIDCTLHRRAPQLWMQTGPTILSGDMI